MIFTDGTHGHFEEDHTLAKQADIYLKLRPFIRRHQNRIIWDPQTDVAFAPTFEQFLEITTRAAAPPEPDTPGLCQCKSCRTVWSPQAELYRQCRDYGGSL